MWFHIIDQYVRTSEFTLAAASSKILHIFCYNHVKIYIVLLHSLSCIRRLLPRSASRFVIKLSIPQSKRHQCLLVHQKYAHRKLPPIFWKTIFQTLDRKWRNILQKICGQHFNHSWSKYNQRKFNHESLE